MNPELEAASNNEASDGGLPMTTCSRSSTPETDALTVPRLDTRVDAIMAFQTVTEHARNLERRMLRLRSALETLINLHEGLVDGGDGITGEDWEIAGYALSSENVSDQATASK